MSTPPRTTRSGASSRMQASRWTRRGPSGGSRSSSVAAGFISKRSPAGLRRSRQFRRYPRKHPRPAGGGRRRRTLRRARAPRSRLGCAAQGRRPRPHRPRAGSVRGNRPRDSSDWHRDRVAAAPGRRPHRQGVPNAGSRRALPSHRCAFRRDARPGALDEVRALDAPPRSAVAGDEGPWGPMADPPSRRRDRSLSDAAEAGQTRHPGTMPKRQFTWFRHQLGDWPRADPKLPST